MLSLDGPSVSRDQRPCENNQGRTLVQREIPMTTNAMTRHGEAASRRPERASWSWTTTLLLQLGLVIYAGQGAIVRTYDHPSQPTSSLLAPVCLALYQLWQIARICWREKEKARRIEQVGTMGETYFLAWMVIILMYSALSGLSTT